MDFGVQGWQCNTSIHISDRRDEYIMKKYIEKRWVATSKTPEIPTFKSYRNQETRVIEFVSSGELFRLRQGIKGPSCPQNGPLRIIRRGEEISETETPDLAKESPEDTLPEADTSHDSSSITQSSTDSIFDNDIDDFSSSFKYQIMSPCIAHSSHHSSPMATYSQVSSSDPPLNLDTMLICPNECHSEPEEISTVMVRDIGTQTDW
jgi:hypothetical protein